MTTSFSGVGSAEIAGSMLGQHFASLGMWPTGAVRVYSACEIDRRCQRVLLSHHSACKAEHVFSDVLEVLPRKAELELRHHAQRLRRQLADTMSGSSVRRPERQETLGVLAESFHRLAEKVLQEVEVQTHASCVEHGRACPCAPSPAERANRVWLAAAGSPCVAFCKGAFGNQEGFLHDSAVCLVAWAAKNRAHRPDVIVRECVPGFSRDVLSRYLNTGFPSSSPLYRVESVVWNVLDEGLPVSRERRYTICVLAKHGGPTMSLEAEVWHDAVFSNRCLAADVYLRATATDIEVLRSSWASKRRLPSKRKNSKGQEVDWAWEALLTSSQRQVLCRVRKQAQGKELEWLEDMRSVGVTVAANEKPLFRWLVNLSQSMSFQPVLQPLCVGHMPALLRSSRLFVDASRSECSRPIHPFEMFAMQCLPVYLPADHPVLTCCNMELVLRHALTDGVSLSDLYSMAGNGMNANAVGQIMMFALAVNEWRVSPAS